VKLGESARFVERNYASDAGNRDYKVYIPANYRGSPVPLIVMLHGCTQTPDDFATGTGMNELADRQGFLVAYPAQSVAANGLRCWNWFNARNQDRAGEEPALIAGITRQVATEFAIDEERIFIAGLSAGAAMAVILGATYPDLFSAAGVHSGLPFRAARNVTSALAAMRRGGPIAAGSTAHPTTESISGLDPIRTIVFHGDEDPTVEPVNGLAIVEQALARAAPRLGPLQKTIRERGIANGRQFTATTYRDSKARPVVEHWVVHGAGHAWSGGSSKGSYTDERGPHASAEMVRFFLQRRAGRLGVLASMGRALLQWVRTK
jgi:poly(hydroxyalkanoate) depolymerase family esterase